MIHVPAQRQGYILVSVTAVLLAVLLAIVGINQLYTQKIQTAKQTSPLERQQLERSALAHLDAFAAQSNCGVDASPAQAPHTLTVNGNKDAVEYALRWTKNANGTRLAAEFKNAETNESWTLSRNDFQLYGKHQNTTWVLAPYFSEFAEIKIDEPNVHHDHNHHKKGKIQADGDMILRSLKLGPLRTEPLTLTSAELLLTPTSAKLGYPTDQLRLSAVKYPWDPKDVSYKSDGLDDADAWSASGQDKFETLDTRIELDGDTLKLDMTGLLNSWLTGTRANYGWAFHTQSKEIFNWYSAPQTDNFETRPKLALGYRCACAEACVGVRQDEVLAMGSLNPIAGHGGSADTLTKLWLHRAHQDYLELAPAAPQILDRDVYTPAGLSDLRVMNLPAGQEVIGLYIEPANDTHPDHHHYTLMAGKDATLKPAEQLKTHYANAQLIYLQSPADQPIGTALANRALPSPNSGTDAANQMVTDYLDDTPFYVGGMSMFEQRYWFGYKKDHAPGEIEIVDVPYRLNPSTSSLHIKDTATTSHQLDTLAFNIYHVQDAVHVIDQFNILLSGEVNTEAYSPGSYESTLGHLKFHDGDIVLYNTHTKTARLIDGEISRSNGNNVFSIALYREPTPSAGSSPDAYKDAFPMLFETLY